MITQVAVPPLSVDVLVVHEVAPAVPPTVQVTGPVGAMPAMPVTVAVNMRLLPSVVGGASETTLVGIALETTWLRIGEVEPEKLPSVFAKTAVIG